MATNFNRKSILADAHSEASAPAPAETSSNIDNDAGAEEFTQAVGKQQFENPPHLLIIGGGSRGNAYASATQKTTNAVISAVCEPVAVKREQFGRKYIWGPKGTAKPEQEFTDWKQWVKFETSRRERERAGEKVEKGIDAVFICVMDELHEEVVTGIAKLGVHICLEKPLSTSLKSCLGIYGALKGESEKRKAQVNGDGKVKDPVFGICHVLRYSPHNMLLRHLVREQEIVGDVLSVEHVEPVGWWHYTHSYVRGNWRKESTTAPSLLTKSCHDMDFLLWLLCSPTLKETTPHLPSSLTSTGFRRLFKKERKPKEAGDATNCLSCPIEPNCTFSAKKIYVEKHLEKGDTDWPVNIAVADIEDIYNKQGLKVARQKLLEKLAEDYTADMPAAEVAKRNWFGRCVWESDNDVLEDQMVTITWEDDPIEKDEDGRPILKGRGGKTAQFHMVAYTEKICERRGRIYGTKGEIEYDSETIKVHDFATEKTKVYHPHSEPDQSGHGGGDEGLARQFIRAVEAVDNQGMATMEAQKQFLGCNLEEAFRSHALVFAAEDARKQRKVLDWKSWWEDQVESNLHQR